MLSFINQLKHLTAVKRISIHSLKAMRFHYVLAVREVLDVANPSVIYIIQFKLFMKKHPFASEVINSYFK